jgi:hypothetical protein
MSKNLDSFLKLSARGYNRTTLFLREMKTGTWSSRLGDSQKYIDNKICSCVTWDSDLRMSALAIPGKN